MRIVTIHSITDFHQLDLDAASVEQQGHLKLQKNCSHTHTHTKVCNLEKRSSFQRPVFTCPVPTDCCLVDYPLPTTNRCDL